MDSRPLAIACLAFSLCGLLGACASKPPPVVAAADPAKPAASPHPHARPKLACSVVHVNLPALRKQALFEQFASQEGAAAPPPIPPPVHARRAGCRLIAK